MKTFKATIIGIPILLATVLQAHEITRPYKSSDWTSAQSLSSQVKFTELENTVNIKSMTDEFERPSTLWTRIQDIGAILTNFTKHGSGG